MYICNTAFYFRPHQYHHYSSSFLCLSFFVEWLCLLDFVGSTFTRRSTNNLSYNFNFFVGRGQIMVSVFSLNNCKKNEKFTFSILLENFPNKTHLHIFQNITQIRLFKETLKTITRYQLQHFHLTMRWKFLQLWKIIRLISPWSV